MSQEWIENQLNLTLESFMGIQPQRIYSIEQERGTLVGNVEEGPAPPTLLPLDLNLVSNESRSFTQDAIALDSDFDFGPTFCCQGRKPHGYHIFLIYIAGGFCLIFGCVEIGLGLHLENYFLNLATGVWWAAVPVLAAGLISFHATSSLKLFLSSGVSLLGTIIAVVGLYNERSATNLIGSIVACSSQTSATSDVQHYSTSPSSSQSASADVCLISAKRFGTFQYQHCYCTYKPGSMCTVLVPGLAPNCGSVMTTYSSRLVTSSVIMALAALFCLVLTALSCTVLMCPGRLGGVRRAKVIQSSVTHVANFGVTRRSGIQDTQY